MSSFIVWTDGAPWFASESDIRGTTFSETDTVVPEHQARLAPELLAELERTQWDEYDMLEGAFCGRCGGQEIAGHDDGCERGALIAKARGTVPA